MKIFKSRIKSYILIGFFVFVLMVVLSFYLTYQQYQIISSSQKDATENELHTVKDNLSRAFMYDFSSTKTLAFIVENYGVPKNFDSIARLIIESNSNIDALQLTSKGLVTHVYPLAGNESVLGYDVLKDPVRNKDALLALKRRNLVYTKPIELKQGGKGIVGRLPIFINNEFYGFSVAIIRFPTLLKFAGIDADQDRFAFQLSKVDPLTKKVEFFLPGFDKNLMDHAVSCNVLNGEWKLYVADKHYSSAFFNVLMFIILGLIMSVTSGIFAFYLAKQPEKLRGLVRKKTLQLAESEKYFRSLIEKSSDAIVLLDANGRLLYQSPSTETMLGYTINDINSKQLSEFIHPEDKRKCIVMFSRLLLSAGSVAKSIYRVKSRKGEFLWLEGTFTNLLSDSSIQAVVFNFHDVTKRVEAELVLQKLTGDLMHRNTDLQQFTFIVSHNLRAPIANILGLISVLEYTGSETERKQIQSYLFSAAQKMDEIINDLNKILQVRNENTENKERVNLNELVNSISLAFENVLQQENVKIITDFSAVPEINTRKSYLQSIFYNLILNSIKYRQADRAPVINIKAEKSAGKIIISFQDNGRGIDMQRNGFEIFHLYKRFHHDVEGKGLGLYMVKTQVEALGGTIEVKSELDKGTEFIITFNF